VEVLGKPSEEDILAVTSEEGARLFLRSMVGHIVCQPASLMDLSSSWVVFCLDEALQGVQGSSLVRLLRFPFLLLDPYQHIPQHHASLDVLMMLNLCNLQPHRDPKNFRDFFPAPANEAETAATEQGVELLKGMMEFNPTR
jgi:hypothetical protein